MASSRNGHFAAGISRVGWHWEFAPSFLAKLMPGVDLVPLWTLAVGNVLRKSKQMPEPSEAQRVERHVGSGEAHPRRPQWTAEPGSTDVVSKVSAKT